jgi:hypothetical protein
MDPLSISASCAGLITLIAGAAKCATRFVRACRDARPELTTLVGDLSQLRATLELLQDDSEQLTSSDDNESLVLPENMKNTITSHLRQCQSVISEIESLLKSLDKGKTMPIRWAMIWKDRFMPLVSRLREYSQALGLTIDVVGL